MSKMPAQKPGSSEQSVETPDGFIMAVLNRLNIGEFLYDLAADESNTKADNYITKEQDSLTKDWAELLDGGWGWLNPEYSNIAPWVAKCWEESRKGASIVCLVPSSTSSNWWANWVNDKAYITYLNGRIKFVGHKNYYPKDCALLLYAPYLEGGSCIWTWAK